MPVGPNRQSTIQRITLRIDEVDIAKRLVHGYDKTNVLVVATFRETPSGILLVPSQNERWVAERQGLGHWRLVTRLDSADQQTYVETTLAPGDMRIAANNIYFTGTVHGVGGGGSGTVTSVTAGDASIVIGGTAAAPTVETADLRTISTLHPTIGDVSMNSHKITNLAAGVLATDAANVGQIPTTFPPSGAAGGDLTGTYPNPTIKSNVNLPGAPTTTTPATADNSTLIATTAFVKAQGYVTATTAPVTSVFGRTGAVVATTGDYSLTQINKGTQHRLVISGASTLGDFAAGTSGQLLQSAGSAADPAWTTSTYPSTAGGIGHVPRSDGTNYVDAQLAATDLSNGTVGLGNIVLATGPAMTNPTANTQSPGDNSTKLATTAFVTAAITAAGPNIYTITQTAHGFSVGNVLMYTGTAYALAKADNVDNAEVVGIVASVIDANNFTLQVAGEVTTLSGLTAGTTYFLSDATAGLLTATAPTANGSISKPLGVAVSTTALFFFNMRGEVIQAAASFPTVTTSAWSGGPPSSPSDGDLWIASGVDGNGVRWQFQYNAGSSSPYKWEFIGGAHLYAAVEADEATTSTTYVALTTAGPSLSLGRAGDWDVTISAALRNSTANDGMVMSYDIGATAADDSWGIYQVGASNSTGTSAMNINGVSRIKRHTGLAANTTLTAKYRAATAGTGNANYRRMSAVPVRIS